MTIQELEQIAAGGESETVEFKKSTAQLPRAGEALCAFLNGQGGRVFIGVTEEGRIVGQQVSDGTLREIAAMLARFEPPALVSQERISLSNGREVLVLAVPAASETGPFTCDGRPYHRVGSTTSVTPQPRYEGLLLQRAHVRSRWENTPAPDVGLKDLDREEILRTVRLGIDAGRLPESTGRNTGDILDRLSLRKDGQILNSAVVLFGKPTVFGYPQRKLRLARVELTTKAGHPAPKFEEIAGSLVVRFRPKSRAITAKTTEHEGTKSAPSRHQVTPEVTPEVRRMLFILKGEMNRSEIMTALGLNDEKHFRQHYQ
jgi:ATP-dependent DNA helicase RecG